MNLSRREPVSLFEMLHRDFDRMAARQHHNADADDRDHLVADWVPAVDIIEEDDRFLLRADVPGVSPDDIDINMENGILSVSGERRMETSSEAEGVRRMERRVGKFFRRFSLPDSANPEQISAKCSNGILEVIIPKEARVKARRITVEKA